MKNCTTICNCPTTSANNAKCHFCVNLASVTPFFVPLRNCHLRLPITSSGSNNVLLSTRQRQEAGRDSQPDLCVAFTQPRFALTHANHRSTHSHCATVLTALTPKALASWRNQLSQDFCLKNSIFFIFRDVQMSAVAASETHWNCKHIMRPHQLRI